MSERQVILHKENTSLLSSGLYRRFWNFTKSARPCRVRGLLPPVGNCTLPRRYLVCAGHPANNILARFSQIVNRNYNKMKIFHAFDIFR